MAPLKLGGAVLLLLFFSPLFTEAQYQDNGYITSELDALQVIWTEWNKSTPNPDSNLADWSFSQKYPCSGYYDPFAPNWRGIECLPITFNDTSYILVTGLSLRNASIAGTLPAEIGNFRFLSTLELSGNPKLTGAVPQEIKEIYLQTLDLHANAFNGTLPEIPAPYLIMNVDLSDNEFVGEFHTQIQNWQQLQTLNLARNQFNDGNLTNTFINMTQLVSLDLSTNKLTGPLPNLTNCRNLQSLKLANNNLTGNFPLFSYVGTSDNKFLSVLDLSGNQLTGSATGWDGSDLTSLKELYLDNTGINGTLDITQLIAGGLVRVNGSGGLRKLSMLNSSISDVIYTAGSIENITTVISLHGSPYCQKDADDGTRCFCEHDCRNQGSMSNKKVVLIATVASTLSVFFIVVVIFSAFLYRTRRYKRYLLLQVQQKFEEFDVKPTIFSFNEGLSSKHEVG